MKISFVLNVANLAGGNRVIATYAQRLKARGHQVTIVSTPPRPPSKRERLWALLRGQGWLPTPRCGPSYFDGLDLERHVVERYRPITAEDVPDADVVVATLWKNAAWVATFPDAKGAKVLFIQGYETMPGKFQPLIDLAWRLPFHKILISHWLADLSVQRFGDRITSLVPNSVDTCLFHAPPRGKQLQPTIGLLYSLEPMKGLGVALEALNLARRRLPELRIVAFGAVPQARHQPLPMGAEYHFQPPQHMIRELYTSCDAWLCASWQEGFHLPPLEAMACRCPVVSTRAGGPLDIMEDGVNGYLVDAGDAAGLADRLVEVLRFDAPRWRVMSDAALATATRYTWDEATALFETALKLAVERAGRGEIAGGAKREKVAL